MSDEATVTTDGTAEETPQAPGWMAQLPDDYKGDEGLAQFKTLGDFAKAYKETSTKASELEGKIPKAPESPDEYEFDEFDLPVDEEFLKDFKATAHKNGMTKDQAKEVAKLYSEAVKDRMEKQQEVRKQQMEKTSKSLKDEWGEEYDAKVEYMKKGISQFGNDELNELLNTAEVDGTVLGNHPQLIKFLSSVGEAMADDNWTPKDKSTDDYDDGIIIRGDDSIMAQYRRAE